MFSIIDNLYKSLPEENPEVKHMSFESKRCYYEKRVTVSIGFFHI